MGSVGAGPHHSHAGDMEQDPVPPPQIILMDVPQATSQKHWCTLAGGLEAIKAGKYYDKRYNWTEKTTEPPILVAFCNEGPPQGVMTGDVFYYFKM